MQQYNIYQRGLFFPHIISFVYTGEVGYKSIAGSARNAPYMPNRKTKIAVLKMILFPSTAVNNQTAAIKYNSVHPFT